MGDVASWIQESAPERVGAWRRVAGIAVIVVVVLLAAAFLLGMWNPWRLVVLQQWFANPWLGLGVVAAGTYLALWLLLPVRNEARQHRRLTIRAWLAVLAVLGLVVGGILSLLYRYDSTELARSPDGQRAVALVISGGLQERELRIWEGTGWLTREIGSLGRPCSRVEARFAGPHTIVVNQGYGDWEFELDPRTGQPQQVLGPACPDGPRPATLGE